MTVVDGGRARPRPSPEALLEEAAREERGRLKIFLGAAPGVGKTYEMLQSAQRRKREGIDVVVAVVETHGRVETEALLQGLEVIPRRHIDYRGHVLDEMDLDAVLLRKPAVALVDELAHTNAPGSRHPKRYLDVEELLAAGIDVYTTVNIQHVESLNDAVAQITRIRVREMVPDSIIDRADEIEVIDLTPDDLMERLREGKVYVPEQAKSALENYFSPGNLTALRELALRRTAERVDEQLRTHMQAHAIAGPWPAGERVLVCISEDPRTAGLVRYAKRTADRLHAPWTALYIETARSQRLSEEERTRIADGLRSAERLGGEAVTLPGSGRVADDLLDYARQNNVTNIVIGKSSRSRWFELLQGSVVHELVRGAGAISVHVIAGELIGAEQFANGPATAPKPSAPTRPYLVAIAAVTGALAVGKVVMPVLGLETIDLIFIAAVLGVAIAYGLRPSLLASVLASLAYNFFFLPPVYTFTITDPTNVAAFFFFLIVAIIGSNLAARVRAQMLTARGRARTTEALYSYARKISGVATLDDLLWAASHQIAAMLKLDVVFLLPEEGRLVMRAAWPPEDTLDDADMGAAKWAFENNKPAGRGADTLTGAKRLFLPIGTARGGIGVVGLTRASGTPLLSPDERRLFDALADQTAIAIEQRHDLMGMIETEADRLGRFVANLLDMARLSSGPIELRREPVDIGEVAATALRRSADLLKSRSVQVEIPPDLPMFSLDAVLFEQVLVNLIDNAARYSPPQSTLTIRAVRSAGAVEIEVLDEGPGIPPQELERVFERFHRVATEERSAGTGLGLAICKGFVEALGGSIAAGNRKDRSGAVITVRFPSKLFVIPSEPEAAE